MALAALLWLTGCVTTWKGPALGPEFRAHGVAPAIQAKVENLRPLDLGDIEHSVKQGVPDQTILDYLKQTGAVYSLKVEDIDRLRANHVSEHAVNFLLSTPSLYWKGSAYRYPWYPYPWYAYPYYGAGFYYFGYPRYAYPHYPHGPWGGRPGGP